MRTRLDLPAFLKERGVVRPDMLSVEVGTWRGEYAKHLRKGLPGQLYLVDAWACREGYADELNTKGQKAFDDAHAHVLSLFSSVGDVHPIKMFSLDAAERFASMGYCFDFIYLDADHSYEACREDIRAWWPLVREGGVLAGHDYLDETIDGTVFGVKRAVDEFASLLGCSLVVTNEAYPTWVVQKAAR